MTAIRPCPRCGAPLPTGPAGKPADAPCPRCLLELGFSDPAEEAGDGEVPTPEELAPHFPHLEICELVGRGGMGAVYRAKQRGLEREVALKVLTAEHSGDPAFAERFAREARALASLSHPNITAVHDFGRAGDHYYLMLELVDGANLRQILAAGGLSPREALAMVGQMCDALSYAHDHGVVHRDIKPENVLVDRKGRLKLVDFGLAKILGQAPVRPALTRTHQAMGTLHYMAPEQVERPLEVDHRADIFSLGVVLYEMLTGELPLGRFSPPSKRVEVDVRLDDVVLKALQKEPEQRYQTAGAVKTDVETISKSAPQLAAAAARHPRKNGGGVMKVFLGILAVMMAIFLLFGCLGAGFLLLGRAAPPVQIETEAAPPERTPAAGRSDARATPAGELDRYAKELEDSAARDLDADASAGSGEGAGRSDEQ